MDEQVNICTYICTATATYTLTGVYTHTPTYPSTSAYTGTGRANTSTHLYTYGQAERPTKALQAYQRPDNGTSIHAKIMCGR